MIQLFIIHVQSNKCFIMKISSFISCFLYCWLTDAGEKQSLFYLCAFFKIRQNIPQKNLNAYKVRAFKFAEYFIIFFLKR